MRRALSHPNGFTAVILKLQREQDPRSSELELVVEPLNEGKNALVNQPLSGRSGAIRRESPYKAASAAFYSGPSP